MEITNKIISEKTRYILLLPSKKRLIEFESSLFQVFSKIIVSFYFFLLANHPTAGGNRNHFSVSPMLEMSVGSAIYPLFRPRIKTNRIEIHVLVLIQCRVRVRVRVRVRTMTREKGTREIIRKNEIS